MASTRKSRVVSSTAARHLHPGVSRAPTAGALGSSRDRGAGARVARGRAGRALAALAAALAVAACDPELRGNGVAVEKTLDLAPFEGVRVEDGVGAIVTVDPTLGGQTVKLVGDENLVEEGHIQASLVPDTLGSLAVTVLRVRVESGFTPTIPPKVVVSRPSFSLARGLTGGSIELKRPAGSTAVGALLGVALDAAALNARAYPTAGALVALTGGASARLHADGPVTGTVSGGSVLDNTLGAGPCLVTTSGAATVTCH